MIPQKLAQRVLKNALVIWVNPKHIRYNVGSNRPLTQSIEKRINSMGKVFTPFRATVKIFAVLHPFVLSSSQFPKTVPNETLPKYAKVYDLFENQTNHKNSWWYKNMMNQLRLDGVAVHKNMKLKTVAGVEEFFAHYVYGLIETMSKEGYNDQLGPELPNGMIGPGGEILKSDGGNHRLAVAQCVGAVRFPILIKCVHAEWLKSKGISPLCPSFSGIATSLREVQEHYGRL